MKKSNKITVKVIFLLVVLFAMLQVNCMSANATENNTMYSQETKELMNKFPMLEESLKANTTGELVDSSEVYVKFTKKQNFTLTRNKSYSLDELDTDFDVNYYTKEQYIAETKLGKQLSTRSIGAQEGGNSSWLKMTLQVYYGNGSNKYFAYNCCSWLTSPLCRFTDGIGITVSSHLIISGDSGSRHSEYIAGDSVNGERYYTNSYVDINQEGNGVLAKFGLYKDNMCWQGEFHNFMVQTGVNFAGYASTEGRISGHYVHKQVGVGSVSMNPTTGIPSVGIASSEDSVKASVYVSR